MSNQLTTTSPTGIGEVVYQDIKQREEFVKRLNDKPAQTKKQKDYAAIPDPQDGFDTIPIGVLENELDEVYLGLWKTEHFTHQVVANEIVGSIHLSVFDPQARTWITRIGAGAVTIRQKKDSKLTDIDSKIKTALIMDFPKLYAMCIKNAAKTLGKRFGRDLNRKFEDYYEPVYSNEIDFNEIENIVEDELKLCTDIPQLQKVWSNYPDMQRNKLFVDLFTLYRLMVMIEQKKNCEFFVNNPQQLANAYRIVRTKEVANYQKLSKQLQSL